MRLEGDRPRSNRAVLQWRTSLPPTLAPRGLSREQSAAYLGISPSSFERLVDKGLLPKPKPLGSRRVWDRLQLDEAFSALPNVSSDADDVWSKVEL